MGFCLYGNDITDTTSPLEAGLGWITKLLPEKNFPSKSFLEKQKAEGITRKLIAFKLSDKGVPRSHYEIADAEGNIIGEVTSGTMSPTLKTGIGMGYVKKEHAAVGSPIYIVVRGRKLAAEVVKPPMRSVE